MKKTEELVRINVTITKEIYDAFRKDANENYGGNRSYLTRAIIGKYYGLEAFIPRHKEDLEE